MAVRLAFLFAIATSFACGQASNDLWGSIDESYPLGFDRVEILKQGVWLRIEYIKEIHGGIDKVCKLVVNTDGVNLKDGKKLEDARFLDDTVTVERVAATGGDFPPVEGGEIAFDDYNFKDNGKIDGDFTILFDNGRNLLGNFNGRIEEISID